MLKHCVFAHFKDDVPQSERDAVLAGFGMLVGEVEGMLDYAYGKNLDFENKSPDYGDGFVVTFTDRAALQRYDTHPLHRELGGKLVGMCEGGYDGIIVFDIDVA